MTDFVKVAQVADVPEGGKQYFEVDDRLVVVFRVDNRFYCLDDICTHDGGPLGEGSLDGHQIACPRHGARFDVRTGDALTMPATEATAAHQVKVDGDALYVRIRED